MVCRDLDEITTDEQDSKVPRILNDYQEIIASGALYREMESVPAKPAEQLDIVLRLTGQCIQGVSSGERFLECFQEFIKGIGYSAGPTTASIVEQYIEAEERFSRPFFEQHPYIMENYLLNYVFRTLFPFGRAASAHYTPQGALAEYTLMATQYALVNGLLVGIAGHHQEAFGTEHVVKLIQSFSKAVEHNLTYLKQVKEFIRGRNLGTPEGIIILLKRSNIESCRLVTERRTIGPQTLDVSCNRVG
jgi:lysine-N-methylase